LDFKIKLGENKIKYKKPKKSIFNCLENMKTYCIEFYIPINIKYKNKNLCQNKYILGGKIPIITKKGTFIINGKNRVIIHQIIRSPGIYFEKNKKENTFTCTIIPKKGQWLIIKIDKEEIIYSKLEGIKNKIPIITLLKTIGLSNKKIISSTNKKILNKILNKNINKENTQNTLNNIYNIYINQKEKREDIFFKNYLHSTLMNPLRYNLSEIGRLKINLKLYKKEYWKNNKILLPEDILGAVLYLIKVKFGLENEDDIDNLENKRIRNIGELLQNQIRAISIEITENLKKKIQKLKKTKKKNKLLKIGTNQLINHTKITKSLENFFTTNPLSQIMDETNSLSEITQKRKIKTFGTTSTDKQKTKIILREIQPSQYSKLCSIETAEGKNAGLILSFAQDIIINKYGFIKSPYYKLIKEKIKRKKGTFFISTRQEKQLILIPSDFFINKEDKETLVKKNKEFRTEKRSKINFINTSTNQTLSIGTGLIPFVEHNDANRALMGSNMQRQAVSLMKKEIAIVQTGLEKLVGKNTDKIILAKNSGKIKFESNKKIKIIEKKNINKQNILLIKKIKEKIKQKFRFNNKKYKIKTYALQINQKSNQDTNLHNTKIILKNQWIQKGQTLADSKSTVKGRLAIGSNIFIGYMSWEGYNFEDAIIINEKIVENNKFISTHIKKYKTFLINNDIEEEKITKKIPNIRLTDIKYLGKNGIIKKGSFIKKETILVGKIKKNKKRNINTKLLNSIFPNKQKIKNISLRTLKDTQGTILKTKILKKQNTHSITIYIIDEKKIKIGDKLSGRHGNKGIISKITKIEDMPYTQDGTPLDILLNPLGIPSRMNVGQILECLLGLAGKNLKENYKIKLFDEMNRKETSTNLIYQKLYEARKKTNKKWLFNQNNPGKTTIFNGKTGLQFNQSITIGYSYILKLIHLVDNKVHARSTGPYSLISKQPLRGRGKNGGQRFGEMEVWSLEGFGAAYTLQELFSIKSDELTSRVNIMHTIIKSEIINKKEISESLKTLIIELQALCMDIKIHYISSKVNFFNIRK
jgi:DNA-directed RNA polymerase subunit beta